MFTTPQTSKVYLCSFMSFSVAMDAPGDKLVTAGWRAINFQAQNLIRIFIYLFIIIIIIIIIKDYSIFVVIWQGTNK